MTYLIGVLDAFHHIGLVLEQQLPDWLVVQRAVNEGQLPSTGSSVTTEAGRTGLRALGPVRQPQDTALGSMWLATVGKL